MIKSAHIVNYQSWKDVVLNFVPGINLIIGDSDKGKSSLLRAIRWVVFNRPQGTKHFRHGQDFCTVQLDLTKTGQVTRYRRGSINQYTYGEGLDETVLNAVSTDIPQEIKDVLLMNELNVQKQLDSPFLLSMSPPDIARTLNEIANLTKVDEAMAVVASKLRTNQQDLKAVTAREGFLAEESKKYVHLPELRGQVDLIKVGAAELRGMEMREQSLQGLIGTATQIQAQIDVLPAPIGVTDMAHIDALKTKWDEIRNKGILLRDLLTNVINIKSEIKASELLVGTLEAEYERIKPKECPLCGAGQKHWMHQLG